MHLLYPEHVFSSDQGSSRNEDVYCCLNANVDTIGIRGIEILYLDERELRFKIVFHKKQCPDLGVIVAKCLYPDMDPDVTEDRDGLGTPIYTYHSEQLRDSSYISVGVGLSFNISANAKNEVFIIWEPSFNQIKQCGLEAFSLWVPILSRKNVKL